MVQNYNQQPPQQPQQQDSSGMGVVLGILLAVVVAIGAYFFIANRNADTIGLEPAAGTTAMEAPDTTRSVAPADSTAGGTTAPAPGENPAPAQ